MYLVYPRESKEVTARQWTEGKLLIAWVRMDAGGQVTKSLEESALSCVWDGKPWGVWQSRGLVWLMFRRTAEDIHLWLCWVFTDTGRLSLGAGRGYSLVAVSGFSLLRLLASQRAGFSSCGTQPAVWGIFSDQGSNPRPLHWQGDSQPLHHQWSPKAFIYYVTGTVPTVLHSSTQLVFTTVSNNL